MITSYAETVRHFIFPAININWLVIFILVISGYAASRGMEIRCALSLLPLCHHLDGVPFIRFIYPDRFLD
ncbi:hypothetical protein PO124_10780 [Bacillus licheniformis]|nr:hypothetical protein [Bacillus licheniformis]